MERNRRILIVDDQEDLREQLAKLLLRSGKKNETSSFVQNMRDRLMGKKDDDEPESEEEEAGIPDDAYEVETASQGEEAFEMVKKALADGKPYAVLFTDMRMPPGWDGLETSKKIRDIDKNIEIVIMTAYADHDQKTIAETVGTPEKLLYIKKPFQSEEIYQLALSLTSKWNFEETERQRKSWLETVIRSMSRVKTVTGKSGDVYATALKSILTFTEAEKGFIAVWGKDEKWEVKNSSGLEMSEAKELTEENAQRLFESRTTQTFDGKYLIPLKREGYSAVVVLYDVVSKNDPEWYKLLSLLGMTASEVLSSSAMTQTLKKQEQATALTIAISKISNECKNHLSELLDYASMLKEVLNGDSNSSIAKNIIYSLKTMLRQMNDILVYTNEKDFKNDSIELANLIEEVFNKEKEDKKIKAELELDGAKDTKISGDKDMLSTVFSNMLFNSIDAAISAGKDSVKIKASIQDESDKITLAFEDNGPGVSKEVQKNLFEAFASSTKKGGFGIGLALSRQIIEKHGGNISYDIKFSDGARFVIKLPKPKA
jgi:signal transduction histidine kinase/DNA-binding response OmpR family regulator